MSTDYDPSTHPAVQAACSAYINAWVDVANLPGRSELSAAETAAAHEVEYRLYEADKAHHDAWHAASRQAQPELYRDGTVPVMGPGDWRAKYPLLDFDREPVPHEPGLAGNLEATCADIGPDTQPETGL